MGMVVDGVYTTYELDRVRQDPQQLAGYMTI